MPGPRPSPATSYDEVPYASYPYPQTHPDRLATVGALFGLDPPEPTSCRLLELGCAAGGNLIPMGIELPGASFVGVDLSARQIDEGRETAEALGILNVDLRHASITDVDAAFGQFDFVVAHGVYSWVPPEVQDRMLVICAERLRPRGLAYVSYNTYPGWHLRGMIRDMMQYHAGRFDDAATRVRQARALLDFLATSVPDPDSPYGRQLKAELDLLRGLQDSYLFHEHLEEHNEALYFHQFVARAEARGLAYVGEAHVPSMAALTFPREVQDTLRRVSGDRAQAEQYMDFLRNRTFRQTILCRREHGPRPGLREERIRDLMIGSPARPEREQPDLRGRTEERFVGPKNATLTAASPLVKAALVHLSGRWPSWAPFEEVLSGARGLSGSSAAPGDDAARLGSGLLRCFLGNMVELRSMPPPFVAEVSDRPEASPLARLQAGRHARVTNLRHETVRLGDPQRKVLGLLDGTRDRAALARELGVPETSSARLEEMLGAFARAALLRA